MSLALDLGLFDLDAARLDCVDLHGTVPSICFSMTVSGEVKPSSLSSSYSGPLRALLNSLAKLQAREVHTVRTSVM
jgi:hypothetical protein